MGTLRAGTPALERTDVRGLRRTFECGACAHAAFAVILQRFEKAKPSRNPAQDDLSSLGLLALSAALEGERHRTVSSEALAKVAGVKPTQLRKDLTYFGQFGTRGLGYDVTQLAKMITDLLGTSSLQPVVLVGVGNLGTALLSYRGFQEEGSKLSPHSTPTRDACASANCRCRSIPWTKCRRSYARSMSKWRSSRFPQARPRKWPIRWRRRASPISNFAPIVLAVPEDVMVSNVNLAIELENLSYFIQT